MIGTLYTITVMNAKNKPFDIVLGIDGLHQMVSMLEMNSLNQYKVFSGGLTLKPSSFGYGDFERWVQEFKHT